MSILTENIDIYHSRDYPTMVTDEYLIFLSFHGNKNITINQELFCLEENSCVLVGPLDTVSLENMRLYQEDYLILIKQEMMKRLIDEDLFRALFYNPKKELISINKTILFHLLENLENEYQEYSNFSFYAFKGLFQYLMIELYRFYPYKCKNEMLMHQTLDDINKQYLQEINVVSLANHYSVTPAYLSRLFKDSVGYKIMDYIMILRILKATLLLKETTLSIPEICLNAGFHNVNSFIRAFKKYVRVTPNDYRIKHKS